MRFFAKVSLLQVFLRKKFVNSYFKNIVCVWDIQNTVCTLFLNFPSEHFSHLFHMLFATLPLYCGKGDAFIEFPLLEKCHFIPSHVMCHNELE